MNAYNKNRLNIPLKTATKLADIILANPALVSVLPRFGIKLGFGDKTVGEVCEHYKVDTELLLMVFNLYSTDDHLPKMEEISRLDADSLIEYLKNSHSYYIENNLKTIEHKLNLTGELCDEKHNLILKQFFNEYKHEVIQHFAYEEEVVFPYVESLVKGETGGEFTIAQYEDNHSNIEEKLSDLKSILIKYIPGGCTCRQRIEVLNDISIIERDLCNHSVIEEKILVPLVEDIEKRYER